MNIMARHKITLTKIESLNCYQITCTDGCYITAWLDGDNIKDFYAFKTAYCPLTTDTSIYRCITDAKYDDLMNQRQEAEMKEAENNKEASIVIEAE